MQEMSFAARSSQWLRNQNPASAEDTARTHAMMRAISFKTERNWQEPVLTQGQQLAFLALDGLANSR